jgi:ABC-type transport system involved in multi-copper enzyme maturation permease subunit
MSMVVIRETLRRHVTNPAYLGYLALLVIISLGVSVFNRPAAGWPSLITLLAVITGAGAIGPEFSSGTLQLILVKPVTRVAYLLSRVAGIVLSVWIAAATCAVFELIGRLLWTEVVPFGLVGAGLVNACVDTILCVALLVLFGSLTRAYFNVAIYLVLNVGIAMSGVVIALLRQSRNVIGEFLRGSDAIDRALMAIDQNLFPDAPMRLNETWLVMVLSNAAVVLVLACLAFRNREVPYGAD